jgi:hypothetical protein
LVVNFTTKGVRIVQRALTKSSDDRRKSGHKKTKRRITKENEESKAEPQIKNTSWGKKRNRGIKNQIRNQKRKRGMNNKTRDKEKQNDRKKAKQSGETTQ